MADQDLVKEELARVFDLYGAQSRSFRRTLFVLIVSSLALFALLVVPFLSFRGEHAALLQRETALTAQKQVAEDAAEAARNSLDGMRGLERVDLRRADERRDYDFYQRLLAEGQEQEQLIAAKRAEYGGHEHPDLAAWARGELIATPPVTSSQVRYVDMGIRHDCDWRLDGTAAGSWDYVACRSCIDWTRNDERLRHSIARLPTFALVGGDERLQPLEGIVQRACGWLVGSELHWHRKQFLAADPRRVRGLLDKDLHAYAKEIVALRKGFRDQVAPATLNAARIGRELDGVVERIAVIGKQLERISSFNSIGTPVGNLPIGLGQLVLLFPVVLALAYLVMAASFARLAALHSAFVRLCAMRNDGGDVMDENHVAVIAPLWLDRHETFAAQAVKWATLAIPLALITINLVLIIRTGALAEEIPDDAVLTPAVYVGLYGASVLLAMGGLTHIGNSVARAVRREPS